MPKKTIKLTRDQKQRLAITLISHAAIMCENLSKLARTADLDPSAAAQQTANWLGHLPGDQWDRGLPFPK